MDVDHPVPIMKAQSTASNVSGIRVEILFAATEIPSTADGMLYANHEIPSTSYEIFPESRQDDKEDKMHYSEEKIVLADVQSSDCEVDNFFMDAVDNDDFLLNVEEESSVEKEYICAEKKYTTLEDMMAETDFKKPPTVPPTITIGEIIMMIIRYALVNALSFTATFQLFCLINSIFETPILSCSKYLIDKLFYPKKGAKFHAICIKCQKYAGMFEPAKDRYVKCKACNGRTDVKKYDNKNFFITMDPSSPISELIQANSQYYNFIVNERVHKKGFFNDIYDGKLYRDFVKSLSEADKHKYATTTFNTDGAPLFESSTSSIWPIYLMVNELPYNVRTKELVLVGLWFGKNKPDMNSFLAPFVENMNQLSITGIECNVDGIRRCIKVFPLVCCVDSVARAPMQGFVQFNGKDGCGQCLHPGEWVRNSSGPRSGGCVKYPLLNYIPKNRNLTDTIRHAEKATPENPVSGVKSRSCLIDLLKFDLIRGCVPDSMHVCSGVAKQFAKSLFGTKEKVGLMSRRLIPEIDTLLGNVKCPHQVGRLTRPFSEKEFWKSREWENWTLYYSLPILLHILPSEFLMHWALFVEALYILSQAEIRSVELDWADQLLHQFVAGTEKLYSKVAMTFNVHLLLHLSKSVYDWGPLWAHNAFAFESENGLLLKGIHSAKSIHHQICRRIRLC